MDIINTISLECNRRLKINFDGGELSSDAGCLLLREFLSKLGFDKLISREFKTTDSASYRFHTDSQNLLQMIFQICCGYFTDDCADELTNDPVLTAVLGKDALASQPTISRFFSRMDETTLKQFYQITRQMRQRVYALSKPELLLLDLDSTLLDTYGKQEGESFNYHYQSHGYHPLVCYDGMTGDLLKIQLRDGNVYSSNGVVEFLQPLLDEFAENCPDIPLFLRGDSGFATPELYRRCEENGISYAIRLKENRILRELAADAEAMLTEKTRSNMVDYAVVYGEFLYQAGSWDYPRRVVFKIEKPYGQMIHMDTFIVTNMDSAPEKLIKFYCKRGNMENYIKESKNGFDFTAVSSHSKLVNANRLQLHALAYNLFNWFKRLVLPVQMRKQTVDTIRMRLLKIAARAVHSAGYVTFKLCSSCPYKAEFCDTLRRIQQLTPLPN